MEVASRSPKGRAYAPNRVEKLGRFLETRGAGETGLGLIVFIEFLTPLDTAKRLKSLLSEAKEEKTFYKY